VPAVSRKDGVLSVRNLLRVSVRVSVTAMLFSRRRGDPFSSITMEWCGGRGGR
jgi:hypothetical protein